VVGWKGGWVDMKQHNSKNLNVKHKEW
jgi:hypothetical protein